MTTAYTSLLGLALPVTGELSGTWGDVVNQQITGLLDSAVAGTTTLSTDGDVTLTTTEGASNQSRQAILLCSGARTAARNITAPARSKIYTVINATTGGYAVTIRGSGPTTGISVPAGQTAVVAWNGSDFVDASNYVGGNLLVNGTLTVTGTSTLTGAATLTANPTLSAGAANSIPYLNGSKVLTSNAVTLGLNSSGQLLLNSNVVGNLSSPSTLAAAATLNGQVYLPYTVTGYNPLTLGNFGNYNFVAGSAVSGACTGFRISNWNENANGSTTFQAGSDQGADAGFVFQQASTVGYGNGIVNNLLVMVRDSTTFYTANTARMVIDSIGSVGLGVNPSAWNTAGSGRAIQFLNSTNSGANRSSAVASWYGAFGIMNDCYYGTDNNFKYYSGQAAALYQQSAGTHAFLSAGTGTAGNTITFTTVLAAEKDKSIALQGASTQTGTGITFPATINGSSNVNTLDDYEEGTWAPIIQNDAGTPYPYVSRGGNYVKVGNTVTAYAYFQRTTSATSGSYALLSGLPFSVVVASGSYPTMLGMWAAGGSGDGILRNGPTGSIGLTGGGFAYMYYINGTTNTLWNPPSSTAGDVICFQMTYVSA